jgi:predicted flap endonuclease-1-like 5' DNA nuclease
LYEKELGELQDAKAQLEITRIKLENELDILRGSHIEISAQNDELTELEKASRLRLEYLEVQNFEKRIAELESELESFRNNKNGAENSLVVEAIPIAAVAAQADDLKVVEGIGPKIEAVLHEAGILTFEQLAQTDPEHINAILDAAGPRYRIHNPSTWPTQAELAAKNDWDKLKELKDQLLGGRDRVTN